MMLKIPLRERFPFHVQREIVTLALLTGLAAVLLIGVTALSRVFHAQQDSLAQRWSGRGEADLKADKFDAAVNDFRASLRYGEDSFSSQLGLAEALIGLKRTAEASAYLGNLWGTHPENGIVNRELARIAAGNGDMPGALRYYHNAIYAIWPGDAEADRRNTRWELIKYLLSIKALAQAQSELIALSAEIGPDVSQQVNLGQYFLKVQDDTHALAAFRLALNAAPHLHTALAGAGTAAFGLGNYSLAQHYLRVAVAQQAWDRDSASLLDVVDQVMRLDPFRRQISDADRDRAVEGVFTTAGKRLQACSAAAASPVVPGAQQNLGDAWKQLQPQVTTRILRRDQDTANQALDLSFNIERQAGSKCGSGSASDAAVLLISRLHEGS
jgi:tetratricopeptide (TPR) repeat protein